VNDRPNHIDSSEPLQVGKTKPVLNTGLPSPLLIYDWAAIEAQLRLFRILSERVGGHFLYSIKAQPFEGLLARMVPFLDGFSVSSLFEARLARKVFPASNALHLTSPGIREDDLRNLEGQVTHLHFNSLEQFQRLAPRTPPGIRIGLRINHGISSIEDARYNPCRKASKLGVPLEDLIHIMEQRPDLCKKIEGLHFHTHFKERSPDPLAKALTQLTSSLGPHLSRMSWINLGGGYAPERPEEIEGFSSVLEAFRKHFEGTLVLEPGAAIVGRAGSLKTRVIDTFVRDGIMMAVLDTGVHHLPEVFEYQRAPKVEEARPGSPFKVQLVGSSCLAGDLFGIHDFAAPLTVGDTITLQEVGAYSLVKASRFNGHDFPALALRDTKGHPLILKQFGYKDYLEQWGL
jgi:carboxynorspermidine decarboxylase